MSGGQQQQLAIGRALIGNPDLLLLDEPSEGIQPSIVEDIARVMLTINKELGTTILFVEQNLDMIMAMTQRCYVMDKGRDRGRAAVPRACRPRRRQAPPANLNAEQAMYHMAASDADWLHPR